MPEQSRLTGGKAFLARASGRKEIDLKDVAECEDLFLDARRSAALLSGEGR